MYKYKIKINQMAVWSDLLIRNFLPVDTKLFPVTGFPKSGTTWVCNLISQSCSLKFDNKPSYPNVKNGVIHCHRSVQFLRKGFGKNKKIIYVVRDPRDVFVSAFYAIKNSESRVKDKSNLPGKIVSSLDILSKANDFDSEKKLFLDNLFEKFPGSATSWDKHVDGALNDSQVILIKYEDLKNDTYKTLCNLLDKLEVKVDHDHIKSVIKKNEFSKLKNKRNINNDYYRKGVIGDYRNELNNEIIEKIQERYSEQMVKLGYK